MGGSAPSNVTFHAQTTPDKLLWPQVKCMGLSDVKLVFSCEVNTNKWLRKIPISIDMCRIEGIFHRCENNPAAVPMMSSCEDGVEQSGVSSSRGIPPCSDLVSVFLTHRTHTHPHIQWCLQCRCLDSLYMWYYSIHLGCMYCNVICIELHLSSLLFTFEQSNFDDVIAVVKMLCVSHYQYRFFLL